MSNIDVDARLFNAVRQVQSTEETRYYLNGVYIQPHPDKGVTLVATDGHRMLVAHDPEGKCKKPAICAIDRDAFQRKTREPEVADRLTVDASGIATLGTYRSTRSVFIDGTYPDWAAVVKPILAQAKQRFYGKQILAAAAFNGLYVSSFPKIAEILKGSKGKPVKIVAFDEQSAALVLFPDSPEIFGLLMPMRAAECGPALPAFMKEILEPSRKKRARAA